MEYDHAPSCVRFKGLVISCARCASQMKLAVLEPHRNDRLEVLTYTCPSCGKDEIFINSAK
jgi:hypothetical protein